MPTSSEDPSGTQGVDVQFGGKKEIPRNAMLSRSLNPITDRDLTLFQLNGPPDGYGRFSRRQAVMKFERTVSRGKDVRRAVGAAQKKWIPFVAREGAMLETVDHQGVVHSGRAVKLPFRGIASVGVCPGIDQHRMEAVIDTNRETVIVGVTAPALETYTAESDADCPFAESSRPPTAVGT